MPAAVRSVLATPRRNALAGLAALLAALGAFAAMRLLSTVGPLLEVLLVALVSALVLAGLVFAFLPALTGLARALGLAVASYLLVGTLLFATGLPVYIGAGMPSMLWAWPFYLIWLHPCLVGLGLWPCPSG